MISNEHFQCVKKDDRPILFIYLICVIHNTQEYFTCTMEASLTTVKIYIRSSFPITLKRKLT